MPVGNKFRIPDCYYSFISEQGHSRTVRQDDTPPAASTVSVHSGRPNSSGAVAINITVRAVATRLLVTLRCLNVRGSRSRWTADGRCCLCTVATHVPVWISCTHSSNLSYIRVVILTRIRPQPSDNIRESCRRQVVSYLIQRAQAKWSLEQFFPVSCCRSTHR